MGGGEREEGGRKEGGNTLKVGKSVHLKCTMYMLPVCLFVSPSFLLSIYSAYISDFSCTYIYLNIHLHTCMCTCKR